MRNKCTHQSAIILAELKEYGLTLCLCTWWCHKPYWTLTKEITTRTITNKEAMQILGKRRHEME
jgi:hypothetical protein